MLRKALWPVAGWLLLIAAAWSVTLAVEAQPQPPAPRLQVGVAAHVWYLRPNQIDRMLDDAQSLGATHLRWDAPWKAVEAQRDQLAIPSAWDYAVDEGNRRGVDTVLILDYGNKFHGGGRRPLSADEIAAYSRYAQFVVTHFKGRVKTFEIWNEWNEGNGGSGAGTAAEYVKLVSQVYPTLKAIAPDAVFLVGGSGRSGMTSLSGERPLMAKPNDSFLETAIKLNLLKYGDGLSIHPYTQHEPGKAKGYADLLRRVDRFARENNQGRPYPIYVTEVGWTTTTARTNRTVSEAEQAKLLVRTIQATRAVPSVRMLTLYQLEDLAYAPQNPAHNYGLIDGKRRPKPAFAQVKALLADLDR